MKKNKLDLNKLSKQLDDALNSESSESLFSWVMEQRVLDNMVNDIRKLSNCFDGKYKIKFLILEIIFYLMGDKLAEDGWLNYNRKLSEFVVLYSKIKTNTNDVELNEEYFNNRINMFYEYIIALYEYYTLEKTTKFSELGIIEDFLGIKNNYNRMISILNIIYILDDTPHDSNIKSIKKILNGIIYPNIIFDDIVTVNRRNSILDSTMMVLENHLQTLMTKHKIIGFGLYREVEFENKVLNDTKDNNVIYIIEKLWFDSLENTPSNAVGYSIVGYVTDENTAIGICENSRTYTSKDCWAIMGELQEYRYKKIKNFNK